MNRINNMWHLKYVKGKTLKQIGDEYNITPQGVAYLLREETKRRVKINMIVREVENGADLESVLLREIK